ncbi:hypothetical protein [Streptomyces sp. NPDC056549]|uniref:hypothetical protein n=1 Tax=Streptomyces sp. NPDC056549 TaxID=3345864 RepID=UPI0036A6133F
MTRWLGVALLPRADHLHAAVQLQRDIGGEVMLQPVLHPNGNLPHVTVFQGPFSDSLAPEAALEVISASMDGSGLCSEISLTSMGLVYQPTGWLFLALERPPLLEVLQKAALAVLERHLDWAFDEDEDEDKDMSRFTDDERISYERYGYRYTGTAYAPHVTLGRTEESTALELVRTARGGVTLPRQWTFDRLSFYVMGEDGAHAKTLLERPLGQA